MLIYYSYYISTKTYDRKLLLIYYFYKCEVMVCYGAVWFLKPGFVKEPLWVIVPAE